MRPDESFWDFSLHIYAREGVPAVCLGLQDEFNADVNLLLYGCWLGVTGKDLDVETLRRALEFSAAWNTEVVHPLRRIRRWMKDESCAGGEVDREARLALRERVKATELAAEQLQQLTLAAWIVPRSHLESLEGVAANLRRYFEASKTLLDSTAVEKLVVILHAVLPEADEKKLRACARSLCGLPPEC